jgi:hypothetical protein
VLALSMVPIGAGAAGVLLGPALVGGEPAAGGVDLDSHFRYLSGLLLAIGLLFAASVPHIERHTAWFRLGAVIVFCGGLARLLSLLQSGTPSPPHLVAIVLELVAVPLLALWQSAVARDGVPPGGGQRDVGKPAVMRRARATPLR